MGSDDKTHSERDGVGKVGGQNTSTEHIDMDAIRAKTERLFSLVPAIGTRWRWYDVPYRFCTWLLNLRKGRLLPWRLRYLLHRCSNFFLAFEDYEQSKVQLLDDPMENLIVPADEKVTQGAIWVAEFFPPSYISRLYRALSRNDWNRGNSFAYLDGSNAEQVTNARRGRGFAWARIGVVANPGTGYRPFDAKPEKLSKEFSHIELSVVQIGQSLTAVVAFITLSDDGSQALNTVWKATHPPILEWRGLHRPNVEGRQFAAIRSTQRERQRLHDLARTWMSAHCPGYFAGTDAGQPVADLNLFAEYDPLIEHKSRAFQDPLRALGMGPRSIYNFISPQIDGAVLVPGDALRRPVERLKNCWGVIGCHDKVSELNDRGGYGPKPHSAGTLGAMLNEPVRNFLLHTAVERYTGQLRETYSDALDTARRKHEHFSPRQIERLGRELLATSLDLPVVAKDTARLWASWGRRWNGIAVHAVPVPGLLDPPERFDFIEHLGEARSEAFTQLMDEDAVYRDVLSTVATLGANAKATRLARWVLLVAGASLVVSLVTVLVTPGDPSLWERVLGWLHAL